MRIVRACLALLCLAAPARDALAQGTGRAHVLIVSGVAGDPQYADVFFKQATTMMDALKTRFGVPDSDIVYLAENPARDAARIRAFFVHPGWARQGLGRAMLELCEEEAGRRGFRSAELMATLPGERLYRRCGYESLDAIVHALPGGIGIRFVPMRKVFPLE